ncbi:MAG: DUF72 domain-containing protein [bacterium]
MLSEPNQPSEPQLSSPLQIRFGPAGWSYRDWRGHVYPERPPRSFRPLQLLATLFDTLEVNATFYRDFPTGQLAKWCDQVAAFPDFRWCFKLHQRFSHQGEVPTPDTLFQALDVYEPVRERGRLGALLLQFPWSLRCTDTNRQRIQDLLATARQAAWPLVVEIRHGSWDIGPAVFPPVICDQPLLRGNLTCDQALTAALATQTEAAGPGYIRLHGRNGRAWFDAEAGRDERYNYLYSAAERQDWLARLQRLSQESPATTSLYFIANNHFHGQAVVDALLMQQLWNGRQPELPRELVQAYPRELGDFPIRSDSADESSGKSPEPPTLF